MLHRSLHRSMQEAAALCNSRAQRRIRQAPSHADVIPQPRTPSAEATINPGCSGMCSGHSPPAAVYQMLYRSLHRSAQEAAAPRNSRAPRRIRRAANPFRYDNPARNPNCNPRHVWWTSTTRLQDATQEPSSAAAGSHGAAQLQGAAAHPPSISTGLAKYYVKIWDFGGWGPGLKITNGPFGLIAPHIPQLCWGYAYASSWDALCCEQDDAVLGSASRNGPMHLEPAAHPALAGCDIATGVVVRISSGSPRRGPGPAAHRNDRRSHIFPPGAAAAGGAWG